MTAEHPEGWTPESGIDPAALEDAFAQIEREAADHGANYAGGMRHARLIVEKAVQG